MMSTGLTPFTNVLISWAWSDIFKIRSIHEYLMYVRNFAKRLHRTNTKALIFNLDIKKFYLCVAGISDRFATVPTVFSELGDDAACLTMLFLLAIDPLQCYYKRYSGPPYYAQNGVFDRATRCLPCLLFSPLTLIRLQRIYNFLLFHACFIDRKSVV